MRLPTRRAARPLRAGLLLGAVLLAAVAAVRAEELRGRVELVARGGAPARGSDVRQAVVYFEPATPVPLRAPETPFEIVTRGKEFLPRVLAVPRGSRVRFPNADPILHNVFSVSGRNGFDLGLARKGPGKDKRFDYPGLVRVFCNVHQAMVAYILVLETPFSSAAAADGTFALENLPRGPGKLTVWHEQAEPWTTEVRLPAAAPVTARVEVTRPRIPPHLDKAGRSYSRADREKYGG